METLSFLGKICGTLLEDVLLQGFTESISLYLMMVFLGFVLYQAFELIFESN